MIKKFKSNKEKQEYFEKMSFSNLIEALNKKWSHTYIDVPEEDSIEESELSQ